MANASGGLVLVGITDSDYAIVGAKPRTRGSMDDPVTAITVTHCDGPGERQRATSAVLYAGRPRPASCHHRVLEVRDARRLGRADLLELHLGAANAVEETSTVAEQYWNHVELKLVQ
jgi:hypothetical protein